MALLTAASMTGARDDGPTERDGRLTDRREFDGVATRALERSTDPGRHPKRKVRRVHDRVDLQLADVPVPQLDARQISPTPFG